MRFRAGVLSGVTLVVVMAACSTDLSREEVRDTLIDQLGEDPAIGEPVATCVVDRFLDDLDDDELREFQDRDTLTDAERQQFGDLAVECAGQP